MIARGSVSEIAVPLAGAVRRRLLGTGAPTIAAAVIESFVQRLVSGPIEDRAELLTWLGQICASYGDVAALRTALIELPDVIARTARALDGAGFPAVAIDALSEDVRRVVDATWRPLVRVATEPLDEIDARIDVFIARIEARDPLTSEHSRAVGAWCSRIGRRLGLDGSEIIFASRCGTLHDVGKMRTPLDILNAPRALDAREWKIMRAHAAAGEAMIRKVPELCTFAPAVRSHHERLDGRGYPDELPSGRIPLMARIVAVADSFNAMIGRRPYRLPMTPARALDELSAHRGTQFDPEVVDAMVTVVAGSEPRNLG